MQLLKEKPRLRSALGATHVSGRSSLELQTQCGGDLPRRSVDLLIRRCGVLLNPGILAAAVFHPALGRSALACVRDVPPEQGTSSHDSRFLHSEGVQTYIHAPVCAVGSRQRERLPNERSADEKEIPLGLVDCAARQTQE